MNYKFFKKLNYFFLRKFFIVLLTRKNSINNKNITKNNARINLLYSTSPAIQFVYSYNKSDKVSNLLAYNKLIIHKGVGQRIVNVDKFVIGRPVGTLVTSRKPHIFISKNKNKKIKR